VLADDRLRGAVRPLDECRRCDVSALFERLTGCVLLEPGWAVLALFVPLVLLAGRRRASRAVLFGPAALLAADGTAGSAALPRTWRTWCAPLPKLLQAAGLVLLVVALARPVRRDRLPMETRGVDIVLCLDVSSSMTADDMDARRTRLTVAADAAARFVAGRPSDRIGLLCFARYPDMRCPPTLDHAALRSVLSGVATVPSDGAEDATGIGTALAAAAQALGGSDAKSKVAILLTDGAENVATAQSRDEIAPLHAAQLCRDLGVRVYVVAAGARTAATAAADLEQVRRVARLTDGRLFPAADAAAVDDVYASIDAIEKAATAQPRYLVEERYAAFAACALGLILAGVVLRTSVLDVLP
jgi:Ca-activated chloride channel family protein